MSVKYNTRFSFVRIEYHVAITEKHRSAYFKIINYKKSRIMPFSKQNVINNNNSNNVRFLKRDRFAYILFCYRVLRVDKLL